ncbi:unnamed protein product [Mytilus coruscus]|uniref:Uncharacterized protein n=1 Tax=Mytilus coruscus TaxID=42192 RepID=A0A6J8BK09_MYTCO|nr:unnamed protein product [Mytilus coruscus]
MDCVYFSDIDSITSIAKRTIDVFATITESLEVNFQSKTSDFPRQQIKRTMKEMMTYRQNMEFPELDKLFYLLSEMALVVVESQNQTASSKRSVMEKVHNKIVKLVSSSNSIRPIPTFYELLPHIDNFDCRLAAESIIEKLSSKYQLSSPIDEEFHTANGFKSKLPDMQYVNYKPDIQITKKQSYELTKEQRNNNNVSYQENHFICLSNTYVKAKDLSEKTNECFVNIKEGMIVKLKVATDESEVAFGWYKTNPWNKKKWGFFCKYAENMKLT